MRRVKKDIGNELLLLSLALGSSNRMYQWCASERIDGRSMVFIHLAKNGLLLNYISTISLEMHFPSSYDCYAFPASQHHSVAWTGIGFCLYSGYCVFEN